MILPSSPTVKPTREEIMAFAMDLPPSTYEALCEAAEAKWGRLSPEMVRIFDHVAVQSPGRKDILEP